MCCLTAGSKHAGSAGYPGQCVYGGRSTRHLEISDRGQTVRVEQADPAVVVGDE